MHIVGLAQRLRNLISRAARPAHIHDEPQWIVPGDPRTAGERRVDERDSLYGLEVFACSAQRLQGLVQELLPVQRELASRAI